MNPGRGEESFALPQWARRSAAGAGPGVLLSVGDVRIRGDAVALGPQSFAVIG